MAKSATAFRTISEVSAELDVPQHVLRFWETKFPQIRPLKRGGGRRYYRPEDVELLRRIQSLLHGEGYTIKGVQRLLREARAAQPAKAEKEDLPDLVERVESADRPGTQTDAAGEFHIDDRRRAELKSVLEELLTLRRLLRGAGDE
ncbi:MAG TPA: MerR family transcriptional regulator [Arenibaculum sp.]|nr:MerR family transcriptional regulator [Arenibaculum sp.]